MPVRGKFLLMIMLFLEALILKGQSIETVIQAGHYSAVTAVSYSHDGEYIATGSRDKTIILWRSSDGRQVRSFHGSVSTILRLEFNRKGDAILALSEDGSWSVWELTTGRMIRRVKPDNDRFTFASFNSEGTEVVTGSRKSYISVWDAQSGEKISELKPVPADLPSDKGFDYPESGTVYFSTDDQFIVTGTGDNTAILFDAKTNIEIRKYKKTISTCTSCVAEAAITPDNKYILLTGSDSVKMFDRVSGNLVREFYGQGGSPEMLTVSRDNRFISAIEYGVAEVWDIRSGKLVIRAGDYSENKILDASISPDGTKLITGSEKRISEIWNTGSGKNELTLRGYLNQVDERLLNHSYMYWAALVNEAKLSPDGKYIAVGRTGNNAKIIDFSTGKVFKTLRGHKGMVISLCFSSDGKFLATGGLDGKAIVWDVEKGVPVRIISYPDENMPVFSVDISQDGKLLAAADWGGSVVIYDIETGKTIQSASPHDRTGVYQVKFSPNGVYFISAGLDGKLKLTEIDSGEEIRVFKGHTDLVTSINMNPASDRIITSGRDGTIRIWDFLSGIQVLRIRAHLGGAYNAKYDASGKYIVSGGDDFKVKLWDSATGALTGEFEGHRGSVGDVNITKNLQYIISGSRDGSVRLWNTSGKKELISITFMNEDDWFIKNPEGYFDASEGAFSSISFVKGMDLYSISQFFNEFYRPGLYVEALSGKTSSLDQNMIEKIDHYPPPGIEFILPDDGSTAGNSFINCMVKVINNGGGVKEFRVMHNGKRQIVDATDLQRMTRKGQETMKTFEIGLVPGMNEITVSAFSNGDIESTQKLLKINYNGLQKSSDCYLLSVGINKYENENLDLTYARSDAQSFTSFMDSKGEKLFNKIYTYSLLDRDATKARILSTIDEIGKTMKKEDVFIFFYAGHGSSENNIFYFITSEITGLYQEDKLKNALQVRELQRS